MGSRQAVGPGQRQTCPAFAALRAERNILEGTSLALPSGRPLRQVTPSHGLGQGRKWHRVYCFQGPRALPTACRQQGELLVNPAQAQARALRDMEAPESLVSTWRAPSLEASLGSSPVSDHLRPDTPVLRGSPLPAEAHCAHAFPPTSQGASLPPGTGHSPVRSIPSHTAVCVIFAKHPSRLYDPFTEDLTRHKASKSCVIWPNLAFHISVQSLIHPPHLPTQQAMPPSLVYLSIHPSVTHTSLHPSVQQTFIMYLLPARCLGYSSKPIS